MASPLAGPLSTSGVTGRLPPAAWRCGPRARCHKPRCTRAPAQSGPTDLGQQQTPSGEEPQPSCGADIGRVLSATVLVYSLSAALCSGRALARLEPREWRPRRHLRHQGERYTDSWAREIVEGEEAARLELRRAEVLLLEEQRAAEEATRKLSAQKAAESRERTLAARSRSRQSVGHGVPFALRTALSDLSGVAAWLLLVGAVLYAYNTRLLQRLLGGGDRGWQKGRYVYDRSLGGRKVWVPYADGVVGSQSAPMRKFSDQDFDKLTSFAAAASTTGGEGSSSSNSSEVAGLAGQSFQLPEWWDAPPVMYVDAARKDGKQEDADRILDRLQKSTVRGEDYSLDELLRLRRVCQEGNVVVKPKTTGARDEMFRTGVEGAIAAARALVGAGASSREGAPSLDGVSPARFVTGLALDLQVPEERAVELAQNKVASQAHGLLIDALTALRREEHQDTYAAFDDLSRLVTRLPLLDGAGRQVALVASELQDTFTVEERARLFDFYKQLQPPQRVAALAARLLGFNPDVVAAPVQGAGEDAQQEQP